MLTVPYENPNIHTLGLGGLVVDVVHEDLWDSALPYFGLRFRSWNGKREKWEGCLYQLLYGVTIERN